MSETKAIINSDEVLNLVIDTLNKKQACMHVKDLYKELNSNGKPVTEGQLLNIQTKARLNKIPALSLLKDENNHLMLGTASTVDTLNNIVDKQLDIIINNIRLSKGKLSTEDISNLIVRLDTNIERLNDLLD